MDKWEVSIIELKENGKRYKVTRRLPGMSVSETRLFKSKEKQLNSLKNG